MGLETSDNRIAPGLIQASNLVPGQQDYTIGSKAVANMRDALKDGFITANEIGERFSQREGLKKQIQTQALKNALAQQNAEAPLIQPRADLQAGQLGGALQLQPKLNQLANTQVAGQQGAADFANRMQPQEQQLSAGQVAQALQEMSTGLPPKTVRDLDITWGLDAQYDPKTGVVANPEEVHHRLRQVMSSLNGLKFSDEMSKRVKMEPQTINGQTVQVPTWVGTGTPLDATTRNTLNYFNSRGASMIQPKGAAVPDAPDSGPKVDTNGNFVTSDDTKFQQDKTKLGMELTKESRDTDAFKDWQKAVPFYGNAQNAISAINRVPVEQQRSGAYNLNARDTALGEAVVKMLDPAGAVRQFKWDKFESDQPWPEVLQSVMAKIKKEQKFTPESRQELMQVANESIRAREQQAGNFLKQSKAKGAPLSDEEERLASGQGTPVYTPPGWYKGASQSQGQPASAAGEGASRNYAGKSWSLGGTYVIPGKGRFTVTDFDNSGKPILAPAK